MADFICVLHTFGRPFEWNLHIHYLLTEGGFSDEGFWRIVKHFNYTYLRKVFQTSLLNKLESYIGPSFKKTKAAINKILTMPIMRLSTTINTKIIPMWK